MKKMIFLVVSIVLGAQSSLFAQKTLLIRDASLVYDATFVQRDTTHSKLELSLKGSKQLFQSFDSLHCPFQSGKKMLIFKDFNSDGKTDFAVVNSVSDSSDHKSSIDVYFYDSVRRQFFKNARGYFHLYSSPFREDSSKYDIADFVDYDSAPQILLYLKGSEKIVQKINLSDELNGLGYLRGGFEDFDFDGKPELYFRISSGREAVYAIYCSNSKTNQFGLNPEMTELLNGSRGYELNKAQKQIGVWFTHSGTEQETREYKLIQGKGFVLIETIHSYHSGGMITETKRQLINGKWQTTTNKSKKETD